RNLRDLFTQPGPRLPLQGTAPFWPDVFVDARLPRRALTQSGLYHAFAIVVVWGLSTVWFPPRLSQAEGFRNQSITYYRVEELLPSLESASAPAPVARQGEPRLAKQRIISLPKAPDNFRQTIVDPSSIKILRDDRRMPNLVAWTPVPS